MLLETQNLAHAEHLHLGCFRVRLPPVTSAFSLFPCNPQPKSSRQLLPSYWESHLCFAWWKETCVMTDWFGVSLLSLTVDNLHTLVLSSVWPAGSWSMLRQLVVSEESSILLVLHLCHIVNQKPLPVVKDWFGAEQLKMSHISMFQNEERCPVVRDWGWKRAIKGNRCAGSVVELFSDLSRSQGVFSDFVACQGFLWE